MILGIGIDTVMIERFKNFSDHPIKQLLKLYSPNEIAYCKELPCKSAERFAARFAAKEALYKAFSQATGRPLSFLLVCRASSLSLTPAPIFTIDWPALGIGPFNLLTTLTHTAKEAHALVIIQQER